MIQEPVSILVENADFPLMGDEYNGRKIIEFHKLELSINHLGVITWVLHNSKHPHHEYYINRKIKGVKEYHLCTTAYYQNTKFSDWDKYIHKNLQSCIGEDLGFESPREMADYLIKKYKDGFSGYIISFREVGY